MKKPPSKNTGIQDIEIYTKMIESAEAFMELSYYSKQNEIDNSSHQKATNEALIFFSDVLGSVAKNAN